MQRQERRGADKLNKKGAVGGDSGVLSTAKEHESREAGLSKENEELSFVHAHSKSIQILMYLLWKKEGRQIAEK